MNLPARMPSRNCQTFAHYLVADSLPIFIREDRVLRTQLQVIQLARAIETLVATVVSAANHVVATACDRLVGQDQFFECFEIDWKLQAATRHDVSTTRAGRKLVVISNDRIVASNVHAIDLSADLDLLFADKCFARQFERIFF